MTLWAERYETLNSKLLRSKMADKRTDDRLNFNAIFQVLRTGVTRDHVPSRDGLPSSSTTWSGRGEAGNPTAE